MTKVDLDHLRTWVGKESQIADDLCVFPTRALAAALDRDVTPGKGDRLPLPWHWLYFLDVPMANATGPDGHPKKGDSLPPVPLARRMWAAGSLHVENSLILGTAAYKRSKIRSIDFKEGKSGPLVFVNVDHLIYQNERLCISEEQSIVYREMPDGPTPLPPGEIAPNDWDWAKTVTPDPVFLFRFSALTYNGHRIHYDRDYATQKEHYPGLVVHGPLLATLLLDLATTNCSDKQIREFNFRAVRPIFDLAPFQLRGKRHGNQVKLWAVDPQGFIATSATCVLV